MSSSPRACTDCGGPPRVSPKGYVSQRCRPCQDKRKSDSRRATPDTSASRRFLVKQVLSIAKRGGPVQAHHKELVRHAMEGMKVEANFLRDRRLRNHYRWKG